MWGPRVNLTKTVYKANIDRSKTFVVIPFNSYLTQIQFAGSIEQILIKNGLSVLSMPKGGKEIEIRKGATKSGSIQDDSNNTSAQASTAAQQSAQAERIERYIELNDINATYLVDTMCSYRECQVKFTEKDSGVVLGVYDMSNYPSAIHQTMLKALSDMDFIKAVVVPRTSH